MSVKIRNQETGEIHTFHNYNMALNYILKNSKFERLIKRVGLRDTDFKILEMRKTMTLEEIASKMGMTHQNVSLILKKLQRPSRKDLHQKVLEMRKTMTLRAIGKELGMSHQNVASILKKFV